MSTETQNFCRYCSKPIKYSGHGRPRQWCDETCRARSRATGQSCIDCGKLTTFGRSGERPRVRQPRCRGCVREKRLKWILESIQKWNKKHGVPPTAEDWRYATRTHPSTSRVVRSFGSWNKAIKAAGFKPRAVGRIAAKKGRK